MRSRTRGWWCTLVAVAFMTTMASAEVVLDHAPEATGARQVLLWARGDNRVIEDARTGLPAEVPGLESRETHSGGRLSWRTVEDSVDELGMRHVFFRQFYDPATGSVTLPSHSVDVGLPLRGALLGFHYFRDGQLKAVGGTLFDDVESVGGLAVISRASARETSAWELLSSTGSEVYTEAELTEEMATSLEEDTLLELSSTGDGRAFEFVWFVPQIERSGERVKTAIHGRTGELIAAWDPVPRWSRPGPPSCDPWDTTAIPTARAKPQNTNLGTRTENVFCSPAPDLSAWYGPDVAHEGQVNVSNLPRLVTYFGLNTSEDVCPGTISGHMRRLPVRVVSGYRQFRDHFDLDVHVPGAAGGDALFKATRTRNNFRLLRQNTNVLDHVNLVVNSFQCMNGSFFQPDTDLHFPASSVVFCRLAGDDLFDDDFIGDQDGQLLKSAAIDVVGHELGHATIFAAALWPYEGTTYQALHEGWADTMGLIAEWAHEDAGSGPETEDWMLGEDLFPGGDAPPPYPDGRRVDDLIMNYDQHFKIHVDDPDPSPTTDPRSDGIRIPLAFRLSVTGGYNPICTRVPTALGCPPAPAVVGQSVGEMSQVFYRALTVYGPAISSFNYHLSYYTQLAAHDLFEYENGVCTNGYDQQRAAQGAFKAVGHPGISYLICSCGPTC